MPKFKLEEFLLPWEHDGEGNKLDEPKEIDVEQLRKYVYGLLTDKEKAQEERDTAKTEAAQAKDQLETVQREHENDEQRRAREEKEREERYAAMEKRDAERRKLEVLEDAFPDATSARLRKLAKRVTGDEKDWVADAKELVEDGFKLTDKVQEQQREEEGDEGGDVLETVPRVRRSSGESPKLARGKTKSVADELDAAGIGQPSW